MDTGSNSGASQDMDGAAGQANRDLLSDEESFSSPAVAGPSGLSAGASVVFAPRFAPGPAEAVLAPMPPAQQPAGPSAASRMDDDHLLDEDNNSNLDLEGKFSITNIAAKT